MKLDYNKIRSLLKGTPLEALRDDQLRDAILGEYPVLYSDKIIKRIWDEVCGGEDVELTELKCLEAKIILSELELRSISKGRVDISDSLKSVRELVNNLKRQNIISKVQAKIINDQEKELVRYEIKLREQQEIIERYKNRI